jgi:hypothetical protein
MAQKTTLPHSWPISEWPADVYPNDTKKARYTVRAHKDDLHRIGALVRVGRELVIIGAPYSKWLQRNASRVPGYECPANKPRDAA